MQMTSSKFNFSIPKTQPTLSSSSKSRLNTNEKIAYLAINSMPQVSAFMSDDREKIYTHNMNIDYGKLSRPFHQELKKSRKKQIDMSQDLKLLLSTQKFKNLKQYTLNDTCHNSAQKQGIQPPIHALLTQKKAFSTQKLPKSSNPESGNKSSMQKQKKKNRIISVKAYQGSNTHLMTFNGDHNQSSNTKEIRDSRQLRQIPHEDLGVITDRSDRKISHSRIIKTFNPSSGVQTKIITYPDLTQVFKIRQSRKKMN